MTNMTVIARRAALCTARRAALYTHASVMQRACMYNPCATSQMLMLIPGGALLDAHPRRRVARRACSLNFPEDCLRTNDRCKVNVSGEGALYCIFLCFSYARLQTVKWSEFKEGHFMVFSYVFLMRGSKP